MTADEIMREALERLRLHGSLWWQDKWGTPSHVANQALLAADAEAAQHEAAVALAFPRKDD